MLAVLGKDSLTPGLVGLSVSYALSVTQTLNWLVRMTSEVETNIVAVERLKEYSETQREANWEKESDDKLKTWPAKAKIQFKNASARYREGLPLVLKNLSFEVEAEEKVGIVGRTGAGKSSVTLTLFRIIELDSGQISIDDIDIATILADTGKPVIISIKNKRTVSGEIVADLEVEYSNLTGCELNADMAKYMIDE